MAGTRESSTTYEAAGGARLPMLIFEPADDARPVAGVVLFHGGAFRKGSPADMAPHCRPLASRGIFAVSAGYRLLHQDAMGIVDCVADARRAVQCFTGLAASRIEFVRPGSPPTLIHHGTNDETVPIDQARRFRDAMAQVGNECVLREYEGAEHGFHYPANSGHFDTVMDATAKFLLERLAAG